MNNEDAAPITPKKLPTQTWGRWGDRLAAIIADQKAIFAAHKVENSVDQKSDVAKD